MAKTFEERIRRGDVFVPEFSLCVKHLDKVIIKNIAASREEIADVVHEALSQFMKDLPRLIAHHIHGVFSERIETSLYNYFNRGKGKKRITETVNQFVDQCIETIVAQMRQVAGAGIVEEKDNTQ